MKRTVIEVLFILLISLLISFIYSATSSVGIILLKKAFKIKAEIGVVVADAGSGKPRQTMKYM